MNNSGYFGIQPSMLKLGNSWGAPSFSPTFNAGVSAGATAGAGAGALAGMVAGAGLSAISSFMDFMAQGDAVRGIQQQSELSDRQFDLQLKQIDTNKSISDLASLQKANNVYATQLAQAGASNISMQSSAVSSAFDNTILNKNIADFNSTMQVTTARLNTYMQQAAMHQKAAAEIQKASNSGISSLISGGAGIAAVALFLLI